MTGRTLTVLLVSLSACSKERTAADAHVSEAPASASREGFNQAGDRTSCPPPSSAPCTPTFEAGDVFAMRCAEVGGTAIHCGCHSALCSVKVTSAKLKVTIATTPPGATVWVDGQAQPGVTPLDVEVLQHAPVRIEARLQAQDLEAHETRAFTTPTTLTLPLVTEPALVKGRVVFAGLGVRLLVDGRDVSSLLQNGGFMTDVPSGRPVRLEAVHDASGERAEQVVTARPREVLQVELKLK